MQALWGEWHHWAGVGAEHEGGEEEIEDAERWKEVVERDPMPSSLQAPGH